MYHGVDNGFKIASANVEARMHEQDSYDEACQKSSKNIALCSSGVGTDSLDSRAGFVDTASNMITKTNGSASRDFVVVGTKASEPVVTCIPFVDVDVDGSSVGFDVEDCRGGFDVKPALFDVSFSG